MMFAWLFSDPLPVGTLAPDFSLLDDSGGVVKLSGLRGAGVVLVFYPGDDTPGCTKQLCQFRDHRSEARARGIGKFREKFHFPFPPLVDQGQKVAALYHANGRIVKRTVYRIGPDGVIRFARRGMPSPEEVLA